MDERTRAQQQIENICDAVKATLVNRLHMGGASPVFSRGVPQVSHLACLIDHDLNKMVQGRLPKDGMSGAAFDLVCKLVLYISALIPKDIELTPEERAQVEREIIDAAIAKSTKDVHTEQDQQVFKDLDHAFKRVRRHKAIPKKARARCKVQAKTHKNQ